MRTVVLAAIFLVFAALPAQGQAPAPSPPDPVANHTDISSILGEPVLIWFLMNDVNKNPNRAYVRVDSASFQSNLSTTGNLNGVAQYQPLDSGVKVKNLFYLREIGQRDLLNLQWDEDGFNSSRLRAELSAPLVYQLSVDDTRVFHRLLDTNPVDINLNPNATLERNFQRTAVDGQVALGKGGQTWAYTNITVTKTEGIQDHSFYQLHTFNCTNCHTVGFGQNIGYHTSDAQIGLRSLLPWQGAVADVNYRTSTFDNTGPNYTYNLGGIYGVSNMVPNSGSRDTVMEYQAYAGPGQDNWGTGVHVVTVDRTNTTYSATRNASYVSGQAGGFLTPNLTLRASYFEQSESNSISTNLSDNKGQLTLQATWNPLRTLLVGARGGYQDVQYRVANLNPPLAHDAWYELNTNWRPSRQITVMASLRNDNTDHPYFPTDFANKTVFEARATYAMSSVQAGLSYNAVNGSNTANQYTQVDGMGYLTAHLFNRVTFNLTAGDLRIDARNEQSFYLPMPDTPAQLSPGIGGPLFLQSGLPYTANNQYVQASTTIPIGSKNAYVNIVPSWRLVNSDTSENFLPMFPAVSANSRLNLIQSVYGLKIDLPAFGPGERLGLGVEHDAWRDLNASNSGAFDILHLDFMKRF